MLSSSLLSAIRQEHARCLVTLRFDRRVCRQAQAAKAKATPAAEPMAEPCRLFTVQEDDGRGEAAYDLSALFASTDPGQRRLGIGRLSTQPISFPGVPQDILVRCSRQHAELAVDDSGCLLLRDGGGQNGTFINDQRLPAHTPTPLKDGDFLSFGCGRRIKLHASEVRSVGPYSEGSRACRQSVG